MRSNTANTLLSLAGATCVLAMMSGCSSWFQPRSHQLMRVTGDISNGNGQIYPLPRELSKTLFAEHRLEPGDVLLVEPAEFDASIRLSGDQTVQPDGAIELGHFGRLMVAGQTTEEVRINVESLIREKTKSKVAVNVRLVEMSGKVVYVLGEVNSPGAYPLKGNETVLDAIIAAGGVNSQADQTRVILNKPTVPFDRRVVLPVCYKHIVQLGDTTTNYQLEPGDRIYVPSQNFWRSVFLFWLPEKDYCPRCAAPQRGRPPGDPTAQFIDAHPTLATPPVVEEIPLPNGGPISAQ